MPSIETANGTIWFADHRDLTAHVPATIWVHGAGGTHLDWPAELRRLPEANTIAIDLPGHGRSPGAGRGTVGAYAADVIALMDALKLPKATIGGNSMGGAIAMMMALNYPDRVQGLILIGTAAKLGVNPAILNGFKIDMQGTVEMVVGLYYGKTASDSMRRLSSQRLMEVKPEVVSRDYAACNLFDIREQVGRIKQPTLILGGTDDQLTPYKYSEFLNEKIAGSTLVKVEGGGHMMMLEQPEFVGETVRKWLLEQNR